MQSSLFWLVPAASILALGFAAWFYSRMKLCHEGTPLMQEIAQHVREGAMAYLKQQYKVVAIVFAAVAVFETIGPPVVARALRWAGEVHSDDEDRGLTQADAVMEPMVFEDPDSQSAPLHGDKNPAA